jgi:hypothetical protein
MSDFVFNIARGRPVELHRRVDGNDPANSALILVVLALAGLEADDTLRDYDDLGALLAAANNEPAQAQYNRKTLTDTDIAAPSIDDVLNRVVLTYSSQSWTSVVAGDSWAKLLTCYDSDTTAGTDANIVPLTSHDMLINGAPIVPSGVNIQWSVPNGYYISSA